MVGAALLIATGAPFARGAASATHHADHLLRGHMFTRFTESGALGSSYDERLHLCSSHRFVFDTVSNLPEAGTTTTKRTRGTWRVVSAHFTRGGRSGSARVRGVPSNGTRPIVVTFTLRANGQVELNGSAVAVGRSDLCR